MGPFYHKAKMACAKWNEGIGGSIGYRLLRLIIQTIDVIHRAVFVVLLARFERAGVELNHFNILPATPDLDFSGRCSRFIGNTSETSPQ
jgi:hypothetical protein